MTSYQPPSDPLGQGDQHPGWGQAPQPSPWGQAPPSSPWDSGGEPGAPPGSWAASDPYQQGYSGYSSGGYPRSSNATTALVLSIVGLFCCGVPALIGAIMAAVELQAIGRGETDPSNRGTAMGALIIGAIAVLLIAGPFIAWLVFVVSLSGASP